MNQKDSAKMLFKNRRMRTPEEVKNFEEAREALLDKEDPSVLSSLLAAFDDSTEQAEVMWGLVHDAESFDLKVYLREMTMAVPKMMPRAKDWVLLLHQRVLNSRKALPIYRDILPTIPEEVRVIIRGVIKEIGRSKPKLRKTVQDLLKTEMSTRK